MSLKSQFQQVTTHQDVKSADINIAVTTVSGAVLFRTNEGDWFMIPKGSQTVYRMDKGSSGSTSSPAGRESEYVEIVEKSKTGPEKIHKLELSPMQGKGTLTYNNNTDQNTKIGVTIMGEDSLKGLNARWKNNEFKVNLRTDTKGIFEVFPDPSKLGSYVLVTEDYDLKNPRVYKGTPDNLTEIKVLESIRYRNGYELKLEGGGKLLIHSGQATVQWSSDSKSQSTGSLRSSEAEQQFRAEIIKSNPNFFEPPEPSPSDLLAVPEFSLKPVIPGIKP
ncbi:MAG: hypothetical protein ACT4OY_06165 [Alphaproteobacteria bacterium]